MRQGEVAGVESQKTSIQTTRWQELYTLHFRETMKKSIGKWTSREMGEGWRADLALLERLRPAELSASLDR